LQEAVEVIGRAGDVDEADEVADGLLL